MRVRGALLLLALLVLLWVPSSALAASDDGPAVWVLFDSEAELARLAQRLDIWEVHRSPAGSGGRLLVGAGQGDLAWLSAHDYGVLPAIAGDIGVAAIPDYACYRTVEELYAQLDAWAAAYPALTELHAIGQSYEDRPLQVLRLTNEALVGDKPVLFLMAGIHGRELIAPEVAMVFIERLLDGYGEDPDVTWILDTRVIEVLVSANPDGHVRNEAGEPWSYWRKNTNPENGLCGGTDFGVDLNRNSGFAWGDASYNACAITYQGPSPVSETETQAVETFIRTLFSDQRPDDLTSPAPETASGLFISLHSYSDLVLWPWGHTYADAPNAGALAQLGRKLAHFNGYLPQQASDLYPASGTTEDFAYGELGVAAYTFEIGGYADGFYPSCARYDALVQPNVAALLYGAKVARAPYMLPAGPDVVDLAASVVVLPPSLPAIDNSDSPDVDLPAVRVIAELGDLLGGGEAIAAAEAAIDQVPAAAGSGTPLAASDGAFDTAQEIVTGTLPLTDLEPGPHLLFVRGQDAEGNWGPPTATYITVTYGLSLATQAQIRSGRPDMTVLHELTVANTGALSQTVLLTTTPGAWSAAVSPLTVTQAPGAIIPVTLSVVIPATVVADVELGPQQGETVRDVVTVTATSIEAPWLRTDLRLETVALWATTLLPLVLRH